MIRQMTTADLDRICDLETISFKEAWTRDSFEYELNQNPFSHQIVLEEGGIILGYAIFWVMFEQAQLASIAVDPSYRKLGKGWQLLNQAIETAQEEGCELFTLEVRVGNTPAKSMYERRGFTPIHLSKNYYSDGEDALVMGLGI